MILPRPSCQPPYDNARVINLATWVEDNRIALIAWWWECDVALRLQGAPPGGSDDFDRFCRCQHDREARKGNA